ncbi:MAG TPA: hypothetical protein VND64_14560 [Pirellulales bacterium]|nr:hypothetical protein [Pirellulales bacterium]
MSVELAKTWVERMFCSAGARREASQLLNKAAAEGSQATLVAGSDVMANDKACMARWTGSELVVVELSARQQANMALTPTTMFMGLEPRPLVWELPPEPLVTLHDAQFDPGEPHDCRQPLSGICRFTFDASKRMPADSCALQAQYVHPHLPQTTSYSNPKRTFDSLEAELRFSFRPLFSAPRPVILHGTLFIYFQLFTARDWRTNAGAKCVSNVTVAAVELA